jgi:predicted deacylase
MPASLKFILVTLLLLLAGVGVYVLLQTNQTEPPPAPEVVEILPPPVPTTTQSVIGSSVQGRLIESYTFGTGDTNLLFVGGIHGGYEWNTVVLAYEMIDYFKQNETAVPANLTVHIVPNLNPDGLFEATNLEGRFTPADIPNVDIHSAGIGRFNANAVDLNRNFDCRWTPESTWRNRPVSGGSEPFSEPEARVIRDYIVDINPAAAVFWHSRANNVYGSECGNAVAPETLALMSAYAQAAGYGEVPVFDAYVVTGAVEDWLDSQGIPAVTVELETRTSSEFERNLAGTIATLELYSDSAVR